MNQSVNINIHRILFENNQPNKLYYIDRIKKIKRRYMYKKADKQKINVEKVK